MVLAYLQSRILEFPLVDIGFGKWPLCSKSMILRITMVGFTVARWPGGKFVRRIPKVGLEGRVTRSADIHCWKLIKQSPVSWKNSPSHHYRDQKYQRNVQVQVTNNGFIWVHLTVGNVFSGCVLSLCLAHLSHSHFLLAKNPIPLQIQYVPPHIPKCHFTWGIRWGKEWPTYYPPNI